MQVLGCEGTASACASSMPAMVDVQVELGRKTGLVAVDLGPGNVLTPDGLEGSRSIPALSHVNVDEEVSGDPGGGGDRGEAVPAPRPASPSSSPTRCW